MKQRHAKILKLHKVAELDQQRTDELRNAALRRATYKPLMVVTRSCDWFSNRVKELKNGMS